MVNCLVIVWYLSGNCVGEGGGKKDQKDAQKLLTQKWSVEGFLEGLFWKGV